MADSGQSDALDPKRLDPSAALIDPSSPFASRMRTTADVMHKAEQLVYTMIGALLIVSLVIALLGSASLLWDGARDWTGTDSVYHIIDRLLFVLMLVEILHTVHASIRSGTLLCQPFLIVGLIACIRRILVITLETSQITQPGKWNPSNEALFHSSMMELGVLAALIVVLIGGIWVITRVTPGQT